jgi:hypothetical protein
MTTRSLHEIVAPLPILVMSQTVVNRGDSTALEFLKELRGLKCSHHHLGNGEGICFTQRQRDVDV